MNDRTKKKITVAAVIVSIVIFAQAIFLSMYIKDSGDMKVAEVTSNIEKLKIELSLEHEKSRILQEKYDKAILEIEDHRRAKEHEKETMGTYTAIVERAKSYLNSNTDYMNLDFVNSVNMMSRSNGVDPYVIFALIDTESQFDSSIQTRNGEYGLGRMSKSTWDFVHKELLGRTDALKTESLINPYLATQYVIAYIKYLYDKYGNYERALKHYCGGFIQGRERYYDNTYRPKIVNALNYFGISNDEVHKILNP